MDAAGTNSFDVSDILDKQQQEKELALLQKCEPVKTIFKKIQPRVVNPLYDWVNYYYHTKYNLSKMDNHDEE